MCEMSADSGAVAEPADDLVVLLSDDGTPCGTAPRTTVHDTNTPLHLAFSCHLIDEHDRILMTRRALVKKTWPGVWTNSFCGHPRPGESFEDAITRYARHELGAEITQLSSLLPDFRYRAVDAGGIVENEVCPVFRARAVGAIAPNPDEVAECQWVPLADMAATAARTPWLLSPWFVEQLAALDPGAGAR